MKRTAMQHSKLRKLARLLDAPHYAAVGLLESLWHLVARETPAGNVGKLEDADIASSLDWRGDPAQLVRCLVEAGWLDVSAAHRLIVHDWQEHSDDAVDNLLARAGHYYACGIRPRMNRLSAKEKAELIARFYPDGDAPKNPVDAVRTESHKSALPEPLPVPEPVPVEETHARPAPSVCEIVAMPFDRFYQAYPRKVGRGAALDAFRDAVKHLGNGADWPKLGPQEAFEFLCDRASRFAESDVGKLGEFVPHPAKWLHDKRYLDDEKEWRRGRSEENRGGSGDGAASRGAAVGRVERSLGAWDRAADQRRGVRTACSAV